MSKRVVLLRSNPVNPDPPVEKMAETLLENGYQVTVVCWDRSSSYGEKEEEICTANGNLVQCVRLGIEAVYGGGLRKNLKPLLSFQKKLKKWLKTHHKQYDIIHAFDFDTGFLAKKIAKKYNKKLIYHILDFYIDSHPSGGNFLRKLIKKLEFSIINFADATIICTEKRVEQIKGSKPKNLTVIHNTPKIDVQKMHSNLQIKENGRLKIVYVGVFATGRLLEELLEVVKNDNTLELHIGGYGELENIVKKFAEESENIIYYGRLAYQDTISLEMQCDVMTAIYDPSIPNHKYSAPNKFYESLMLNKPLIMVEDTGWDEVIKEKKVGALIAYSKDGLRTGLKSIQNEIDMEQKGLSLYEEKYSWELMSQRIFKLYDGLSQ